MDLVRRGALGREAGIVDGWGFMLEPVDVHVGQLGTLRRLEQWAFIFIFMLDTWGLG